MRIFLRFADRPRQAGSHHTGLCAPILACEDISGLLISEDIANVLSEVAGPLELRIRFCYLSNHVRKSSLGSRSRSQPLFASRKETRPTEWDSQTIPAGSYPADRWFKPTSRYVMSWTVQARASTVPVALSSAGIRGALNTLPSKVSVSALSPRKSEPSSALSS